MKNTKKALKWMVQILRKNKIPFQIAGGLAANVYGANRPLADIDLYIHLRDFKSVIPLVQKYITQPFHHYKDREWDLNYMELRYAGQDIGISDADNTSYLDNKRRKWIKQKIRFKASEKHKVHGVLLPIMPKKDLLVYKRRVNRKVDLIDVQQIQKAEIHIK